MPIHQQLESIRQEHEEIRKFLNAAELALARASGDDWSLRGEALTELREMDGKLAGISEHCRHEEEDVESPFANFLDEASRAEMKSEHDRLRLLTSNFRRELKLATVPRLAEVVTRGQDLVRELQRHLKEEEILLAKIEEGIAAQEKPLVRFAHSVE
jgi:hemerythrin-like domain-containing protein